MARCAADSADCMPALLACVVNTIETQEAIFVVKYQRSDLE